MQSNDRTRDARDHDDSAIIDAAEAAPGGGGSSGGNVARDVASEDELRRVADPEAHSRVTGSHKVQPRIPTRADHEGAQEESKLSPKG